ncbi:MAG TPA: ATP-dependent Clp protease ATP-binding subunit [Patescibacteria group bacterium]|nr:ATP-dependent Clp protease ATP-binding subunit [Patescibacteria group bacterium]
MGYQFLGLYQFYQSRFGRVARCILAIFLLFEILYGIVTAGFPWIAVVLLNVEIMLEVFYRYFVISQSSPKTLQTASEREGMSCLTLSAASVLDGAQDSQTVLLSLLGLSQIQFFLQRAGMTPQDLPQVEVHIPTMISFAYKVAKELGGSRITTMDLLAAYILLTEDQTRLLIVKHLRKEDILQILQWSRLSFPHEEHPGVFHLNVGGGGFGEWLATGWTPETKEFTRNFTNTLSGEEVSIIGREQEYQKIKDSLRKPENNNLVLIGQTGTGKEQLIERLALDSFEGTIEGKLRYKTILELLVGSLLAGANAQGELEERVKAIIDEVSHAENVVLYIPEFQDMLGAGSFSLDLSGALAPYLKNGKLPIIASMTEGNYKTYLERSPLNELFTQIVLTEPTLAQSELMVMERIGDIEKGQKVVITYRALQKAVEYADRYSQSMVLPGSAVTLLGDAISHLIGDRKHFTKLLLTEEDVIKTVEAKTKIALADPGSSERDLLLHLEDELHKSIIGQDAAIRAIAQALRRLRAGVEANNRPTSFLFLGPTGVGKTETAKALARAYFQGEQSMIRLDMSEFASEEGQRRLLGALPGQGDERGELTEQVRDHPYSLILLDEFEKAHHSIMSLFLQILDDGHITDNKGRTVSFINTIIIATSNAGSEYIHEAVESGESMDAVFEKKLLEFLQSQHIFLPELLNRFDGVITFTPLTPSQASSVTLLLLQDLIKQLEQKNIILRVDPRATQKIAAEAYNKEYGARPIRRYLQDTVEELLSQKLLRGEIKEGQQVLLTVENNMFVFR